MLNHIELKCYTPEDLAREWSGYTWQAPPSVMVTLPFPGGVLFGAKTSDPAQRVSFFLHPEDARIIGERLINAAMEAADATPR